MVRRDGRESKKRVERKTYTRSRNCMKTLTRRLCWSMTSMVGSATGVSSGEAGSVEREDEGGAGSVVEEAAAAVAAGGGLGSLEMGEDSGFAAADEPGRCGVCDASSTSMRRVRAVGHVAITRQSRPTSAVTA
jgi:hypothetical protein